MVKKAIIVMVLAAALAAFGYLASRELRAGANPAARAVAKPPIGVLIPARVTPEAVAAGRVAPGRRVDVCVRPGTALRAARVQRATCRGGTCHSFVRVDADDAQQVLSVFDLDAPPRVIAPDEAC